MTPIELAITKFKVLSKSDKLSVVNFFRLYSLITETNMDIVPKQGVKRMALEKLKEEIKYDYKQVFENMWSSDDGVDNFLRVINGNNQLEIFVPSARERTTSVLKKIYQYVKVEVTDDKDKTTSGRVVKERTLEGFVYGKQFDKATSDDAKTEWFMEEREGYTLYYDFLLDGSKYRGRCEFTAEGYAVVALWYNGSEVGIFDGKKPCPLPIRTIESPRTELRMQSSMLLKDDKVRDLTYFKKLFTRESYGMLALPDLDSLNWVEGKRDFRANTSVDYVADGFVSDGSAADSQKYNSDEDYKPGGTESDNESDYDTTDEDEYEESKPPAKKAKLTPQDPTQVYKALRKLHIYGKLKY